MATAVQGHLPMAVTSYGHGPGEVRERVNGAVSKAAATPTASQPEKSASST